MDMLSLEYSPILRARLNSTLINLSATKHHIKSHKNTQTRQTITLVEQKTACNSRHYFVVVVVVGHGIKCARSLSASSKVAVSRRTCDNSLGCPRIKLCHKKTNQPPSTTRNSKWVPNCSSSSSSLVNGLRRTQWCEIHRIKLCVASAHTLMIWWLWYGEHIICMLAATVGSGNVVGWCAFDMAGMVVGFNWLVCGWRHPSQCA